DCAKMRQWIERLIHGAVLIAMFAGTSNLAAQRRTPQAQLPCGDVLSFQILLDRQGFSPGEIDGKRNANFLRALTALQTARGVASTGQPDCATWHALGGDTSGSLFSSYVITTKDIRGPYQRLIPRTLVAQAQLPALRYRSVLEMLGERFHSSPMLLA